MLSVIVTLTVSSFKASSSGDGRKSETTLTFPIGSSVYLIFSFIDFLSFPPISGADYSDFALSVCKPNCHYPVGDSAKTVKPFFIFTVFKVFKDNTIRIQKSKLCQSKRNPMFPLILLVFFGIPLKIGSFAHKIMIDRERKAVNIKIWLFIWLFDPWRCPRDC